MFLCASCLLLITTGCATPSFEPHPRLKRRADQITRPGLFLSHVKIYQVSAGGVVELRDDWCATGKENLLGALVEGFRRKRCNAKPVFLGADLEGEIKEIKALYASIDRSIQLHIYGPQLFPEKASNSDYSLGPLEDLLKKAGVDSLAFVCAFEEVSETARRIIVSIGVADSSGTIVWYNIKGSDGGYDLRDAESAKELVQTILGSFPGVGG
jgi:hypothetical protein